MNSLKFLHFSDLHLDLPFSSLGPGLEVPSERRQDLLYVFDRIIDLARKEAVDIILISGDLYEHNYVKKSTIHYINRRFSEIPQIKVFIVPGNHDPNVSSSYYKNFEWSKNVFILSEDRPKIVLDELNTCVYGVGFESFHEVKSLLKGIETADKKRINLLLVHGTVDMNFKKNIYNPVSSKELASLNMDYVALGHFHKRLEDIGQRGYIYNPGSPEALGFDEEGEHGVFVGRIDFVSDNEKNLHVNFIKTGKREYSFKEIKSDCFESDTQIIDMIGSEIEPDEAKESLIHITLKGYTAQGYSINTLNIGEALKDRFFYVVIKNETIPGYDIEELSNEPGLMGLFVRKMLSLINNACTEKEKYLLMKSMQYGIEALEQGSVEVV